MSFQPTVGTCCWNYCALGGIIPGNRPQVGPGDGVGLPARSGLATAPFVLLVGSGALLCKVWDLAGLPGP